MLRKVTDKYNLRDPQEFFRAGKTPFHRVSLYGSGSLSRTHGYIYFLENDDFTLGKNSFVILNSLLCLLALSPTYHHIDTSPRFLLRSFKSKPMFITFSDAACYAIVAAAILGSMWLVKHEERRRRPGVIADEHDAIHLRLLLEGQSIPDLPRIENHLDYSCLWTTCWIGVHPAWLLLLRLVSTVVLLGLLCWDIKRWNWLIFIYYTEFVPKFLNSILYYTTPNVI